MPAPLISMNSMNMSVGVNKRNITNITLRFLRLHIKFPKVCSLYNYRIYYLCGVVNIWPARAFSQEYLL